MCNEAWHRSENLHGVGRLRRAILCWSLDVDCGYKSLHNSLCARRNVVSMVCAYSVGSGCALCASHLLVGLCVGDRCRYIECTDFSSTWASQSDDCAGRNLVGIRMDGP